MKKNKYSEIKVAGKCLSQATQSKNISKHMVFLKVHGAQTKSLFQGRKGHREGRCYVGPVPQPPH